MVDKVLSTEGFVLLQNWVGFTEAPRSSTSSYFFFPVPFLGLDIVGSVVGLVKQLGAEGLVGLVAVWVLWGIYSKK